MDNIKFPYVEFIPSAAPKNPVRLCHPDPDVLFLLKINI